MNVFTGSGNLGGDAEVRYTPNGKSVTGFSVAIKSGWGDKAQTNWLRCSMWGQRGESVAPYLLKGQQVVISGEISVREWQNDAGETKTSLECNVNSLSLVGGKPMDGMVERKPEQPEQKEIVEDDIPF